MPLLIVEFISRINNSGIVYNGNSLEYWLSQTRATMVMTNGTSAQFASITIDTHTYGLTSEPQDDVREAFRAMGTNCLPFLVERLNVHETRISTATDRLRRKLNMKLTSPGRMLERGQAVTALGFFNTLPDETCEQIRVLSKSSNPEVAASAKYVLQNCHKMSAAHPTPK